jgi:hypothetical protein
MKTFLCSFVAVTFFLMLGCEEIQVTEPTQSVAKKDNLLCNGTINLCCLLDDPLGDCSQLLGEVEYVHEIIESETGEDNQYLVALTLDMSSELCRQSGPNEIYCPIECTTNDTFYVSEEGIYILMKAYIIENRIDVLLMVQYLITTEGVGIPNIWLQEID